MADQKHTIQDKDGKQITVLVRRDKRLKKSSRWGWESDGSILLRVPYRFPKRQIPDLLKQITRHLEKGIKRAKRRTDVDLQEWAEYINKKYFGGQIEWRAIRWVGNMNTRLGSCTNGGSTDGHIRISDKIKHWPQWVIDYVIAHELAVDRHDGLPVDGPEIQQQPSALGRFRCFEGAAIPQPVGPLHHTR